jgi:hypothetical protein
MTGKIRTLVEIKSFLTLHLKSGIRKHDIGIKGSSEIFFVVYKELAILVVVQVLDEFRNR